MDAPTLLKRVAPFQSYINRFPLEYGNIFLEVFSDMEVIFTVIIIMIIAKLVDRIYKRIDLEHYSPIWEYFAKALLYGMITVFTIFYGKDSLNGVTPLVNFQYHRNRHLILPYIKRLLILLNLFH